MTTPEYCFHHTDRETGRHCTHCGRPACPDCLQQAPVGAWCWECVKESAPPRAERVARQLRGANLPVTKALIAINAIVFLALTAQDGNLSGTSAQVRWALFGPSVANGEWYRLVTSGFIHYGMLHILFNMLILYQVGMLLEPGAGSVRFATLYTGSLFGGSFGALVASPHALTGGASGAVFGVAAAATLAMYRQGVPFWSTGFGPLLVVNLGLSFIIPNVSYGGHIGGLIAGAVMAEGMVRSRKLGYPALGYVFALIVTVAAIAGSLVVANSS